MGEEDAEEDDDKDGKAEDENGVDVGEECGL